MSCGIGVDTEAANRTERRAKKTPLQQKACPAQLAQARHSSGTSCRGAGNVSHMSGMQRAQTRAQLAARWHGTCRGQCRRDRDRDHEACLREVQKGARGPVQRILLVANVWQVRANARSVQPVHHLSRETRARIQYGMCLVMQA